MMQQAKPRTERDIFMTRFVRKLKVLTGQTMEKLPWQKPEMYADSAEDEVESQWEAMPTSDFPFLLNITHYGGGPSDLYIGIPCEDQLTQAGFNDVDATVVLGNAVLKKVHEGNDALVIHFHVSELDCAELIDNKLDLWIKPMVEAWGSTTAYHMRQVAAYRDSAFCVVQGGEYLVVSDNETLGRGDSEAKAWAEAAMEVGLMLGRIQQRRRLAFEVAKTCSINLRVLAEELQVIAITGHRDNLVAKVGEIEVLTKTLSTERSVIASYAWLDEVEEGV